MASKPPLTRRSSLSSMAKSATQLIAESTRSVVAEIMPNMSSTLRSGGDTVSDALSRTKAIMNRQSATLDRTNLGRDIDSSFSRASSKIDLAEYDHRSIANELGSYADSFDESTFDEGADGKETFSAGYGANENIKALASMNSTIANSASATINGMGSMTSTLASVQLESSKALAATVKNMSISQTNVLSGGLNAIAKQMEISNRYNAAMLEFMNKNISPSNANMMDAAAVLGQKLDQLIAVMGGGGNGRSIDRNPKATSTPMDRIHSDGMGLDFGEYKKMMREGFMGTEVGMFYQMFTGMKNTFKGSLKRNGGRGASYAIAPQVANFLVSTLIGSNTKSRLGDIDKSLSDLIRHGLYGIGDLADRADANMFQRMIGQIFGVKRPTLSKIDLSRGRKDEVIGWNGVAQTALTQVIPNYLASIEKAISGVQDKRHYDYNTGVFMTEGEIMKSMLERTYQIANDAFSESTSKLIDGLQRRGASQKEVNALLDKMNALIDSRISGERTNDKAYKRDVTTLLSSARISDHDAAKIAGSLETSIEKMTMALSDFHNRISADSVDSSVFRNLFNRFDPGSKNRAEYEALAKKYINAGNFNAVAAMMGGYSPSIHDYMSDQLYGSIKGGTKIKVDASREFGAGITSLLEAVTDHVHARTYLRDGRASSIAAKNRSKDRLSRGLESMRALDRNNPDSVLDGKVSGIGDTITEGIESGNSVSILQSIAMSLHSNLLVPMYSNVFSKKGLLNRFFGDDPNSEFNQLKEKLFGKENGLLTPLSDWLKYQFTGKGYTSRSGKVYEDTDDNIINFLKAGYGKAFGGSMTYLFGENYAEAEGYNLFKGLSPEAFGERKARRAKYKRDLRVEARLYAQMNDLRDQLIDGKINQSQFLSGTKAILGSDDLVATGNEEMVTRLNKKRNNLIDELTTFGYTFRQEKPIGNGRRGRSRLGLGQNDPRWANVPTGLFSDGTVATMATAGCGPTAMSYIASAMGRNMSPVDVLGFARSQGYMVNGGATKSLFTKGASKLGIKGRSTSIINALKSLRKGNPAIIAGKGSGGLFSKAGHIISAFGSNGSHVLILDPETGYPELVPIDALSGATNAFSYDSQLGYGDPTDAQLTSLGLTDDVLNMIPVLKALGIDVSADPSTIAKVLKGNKRKTSTGGQSKPKTHVYDNILTDVHDVLTDIHTVAKDIRDDLYFMIDLSAESTADTLDAIGNIDRRLSFLLEGAGINHKDGSISSINNIFNTFDSSTMINKTVNKNGVSAVTLNDTLVKLNEVLERLSAPAVKDSTTDPYGESKSLEAIAADIENQINEKSANIDESAFEYTEAINQMQKSGVIDKHTASTLIMTANRSKDPVTRQMVVGLYEKFVKPRLLDRHLGKKGNDSEEFLRAALVEGVEVTDPTTGKTEKKFELSTILNSLQKSGTISENMKTAVLKLHESGAHISRENLSTILAQAFAMNLSEIEANMVNVGEAAIDDPKEFKVKFKKDLNAFNAKFNKLPGTLLKGGLVGSLIGLANMGNTGLLTSLLLPGGPIGGAIAGLGVALLSRNEEFKNTLFGKEENGQRTGGIISAQLQTSFKKSLPYAVGGATIGIVKSLITGALGIGGNGILTGALLGTGPIGAAIVGLGLGILKNNETFNKTLFGDKGSDKKRTGGYLSKALNDITDAVTASKTYLKNGAKGAGIGFLTGAVVSNLGLLGGAMTIGGPIGAAIAGLGLGIASTSDEFKEYMFGTEYTDGEGNKKRKKNGFIQRAMNLIADQTIYPLKDLMHDKMEDFAIWAKKNFEVPFKLAFGPIIDSFADFKQELKDTIHAAFGKLTDGITSLLRGGLEKILSPISWAVKKTAEVGLTGLTKAAQFSGGLASMPLKLLAMSTIRKRSKYDKDYKSSVKDKLDAKWALDEENGKFSGRLGWAKRIATQLKDIAGIGEIGDEDTAIMMREAYGRGMEAEGKNHLGWFSARAQYNKDYKEYKARKAERENFRKAQKLLTKWKREDRYNEEHVWTDNLLSERQKELRKYGIEDFAIGSQEDIKQLMFHRGDWQKRFGEFGKENLALQEAKIKEDARNEATTEYQNDMLGYAKEIADYLTGRGQAKAADESLSKLEKTQEAEIKRNMDNLAKAGVSKEDLRNISNDKISNPRFDDDIVESTIGGPSKSEIETLQELLDEGKTYAQCGAALGKSRSTISRWVKKYNLKRGPIDITGRTSTSEGTAQAAHVHNEEKIVEMIKKGTGAALGAQASDDREYQQDMNEKSAKKAKEAKETEESQGLGSKAKAKLGNLWDRISTDKDGKFNWIGKTANKIENSWLGKIFKGVKSFGSFVADSPMAQIALGVGAFLFRDQIGTVIGAIGGGIKDVFTEYLPTALNFIGKTVFPFIYENVAEVVAFAVKTLPGIVWEGIKGLGIGLKDLGQTAWRWMGFGQKSTKYSESEVDLVNGMTADGQYLAVDPITGEYILDADGNYQVLDNYQYITESGQIANISRGTGGKLARAGFNMIKNPRNAVTALNMVGGATRLASNIPIVRKLPGFKTVFGATDRMGRGMMNFAKGAKSTLKASSQATMIDVMGDAAVRKADKVANDAMLREVNKISKEFHKANRGVDASMMTKHLDEAGQQATIRLGRLGSELGVDATKYIDDASEALVRNADNLLADSAKKNASKWLTRMLTGMKKSKAVLSKTADSTLLSKLFGLLDNFSKGLLSKASNKVLTKFASSCAEGILKGASKLVPVIGWAFTAYDAIKGFCDTEYLFGIPEGEADGYMRTISTVMNVLLGLGVGPIFDIALVVYSSITGEDEKRKFAISLYESWMEAAGEESRLEDFHESQEIMEAELALYNADHRGGELTMDEYLDLKKDSNSILTKIKRGLGLKATEDLSKYEKKNAGVKNTYYKDYVYNVYVLGDNGETVEGNGIGAVGYGNTYAQGDPRWGKFALGKFSNGKVATMDLAGCGPTALANVASQMGNGDVSPVQVARMAKRNGYITDGGANAGLFEGGAQSLGLNSRRINKNDISSHLGRGEKIIISGKSGSVGYGDGTPFTPAGHIVTLEGGVGDSVLLSDPQTGKTSFYKMSSLMPHITNAWAMGGTRGYGYRGGNIRSSLGYGDIEFYDSGYLTYTYDEAMRWYDMMTNGLTSDWNAEMTKDPRALEWYLYTEPYRHIDESYLELMLEECYSTCPSKFTSDGSIAAAMDNFWNNMSDTTKYNAYRMWAYYPTLYPLMDFEGFPNYLQSLDPYDKSLAAAYLEFKVLDEYARKYDPASWNDDTLLQLHQAHGFVRLGKDKINGSYTEIVDNYFEEKVREELTPNTGNVNDIINHLNKHGWNNLNSYLNYVDKTGADGRNITINELIALADTNKYPQSKAMDSWLYRLMHSLYRPYADFDTYNQINANASTWDNMKITNMTKGLLGSSPIWNDKFKPIIDVIGAGYQLGKSMGYVDDTLTNKYITDGLYGTVNGLPYFSTSDPRWANRSYKGGSFSRTGSEIAALASILTSYSLSSGDRTVFDPNFLLDYWFTKEKFGLWHTNAGITDDFYTRNGLQGLQEAFMNGSPLAVRSLTSIDDIISAMELGKLVLLQGSNSLMFDNHSGVPKSVVGTLAGGGEQKVFTTIDPINHTINILPKQALYDDNISATVFETADGSGINQTAINAMIGSGSKLKTVWENIKDGASDLFGPISAVFSGITSIFSNMIKSALGGTEYKSIHEIDYSVDNESLGLADQQLLNNYTHLNTSFTKTPFRVTNPDVAVYNNYAFKDDKFTSMEFSPIVPKPVRNTTSTFTGGSVRLGNSFANVDAVSGPAVQAMYGPALGYGRGGEDDEYDLSTLDGIFGKIGSIYSNAINSILGGSTSATKKDTVIKGDGKSASGLVTFARSMRDNGCRYVWGGSCKRYTYQYCKQLKRSFASTNSKYNDAYYEEKFSLYSGEYVSDCSGLIRGYTGEVFTANTLYTTSTESGTTKGMSSSMMNTPGVLVFIQNSSGRMSHVGILMGNGKVIHTAGHRPNDTSDVYIEDFSKSKWTHWGKSKYLTYGGSPRTSLALKESPSPHKMVVAYGNPVDYLTSTLGGRITQRVGLGIDPTSGTLTRHRGTDIAAAYGSPIKSPVSGKIVESRSAGYGSAYGNYVVVQDKSGKKHLIAHMNDKSGYGIGSKVSAGDVVGYVGSSGRSTGPHVHYEVRERGHIVDPLDYKSSLGIRSKTSLNILESKLDDNMNRTSSPVGGQDDVVALTQSLGLSGSSNNIDDVVDGLATIVDILTTWANADAESKSKILDAVDEVKGSSMNMNNINNTSVNSGGTSTSTREAISAGGRTLHELLAKKGR